MGVRELGGNAALMLERGKGRGNDPDPCKEDDDVEKG
jgi:hypothetical protein